MNTSTPNIILKVKDLSVFYGNNPAIQNVEIEIPKNKVTAIIGPSGCGKSTLLRSFNRMNDFIENICTKGTILFEGKNLYSSSVDPAEIRRKIGMVFQRPNPFPKSIYKNIAWGPKVNGYSGDLNALVEKSLQEAALWDEVKDRLHDSAFSLSGGQQQRLCIARAIAMSPEVILMDEPCSALDPKATTKIEDLIDGLRKEYTILVVTHNMQQASRISQLTAFFYNGKLVEFGATNKIFTKPIYKKTEDYITGRFG